VPKDVGDPIVRGEILHEGNHRRVERAAFRPLRDIRGANGDGSEDHAVEGLGVDELSASKVQDSPAKPVEPKSGELAT
jgi:hypothetical protein